MLSPLVKYSDEAIRFMGLGISIHEVVAMPNPNPTILAAGGLMMCLPPILIHGPSSRSKQRQRPQMVNVAGSPGDLIDQSYRRFHVLDESKRTNWSEFEKEIGRVVFHGDPVLHVDTKREYPYSTDECPIHPFPFGTTQTFSIVYQDEPHVACMGCGKILSINTVSNK